MTISVAHIRAAAAAFGDEIITTPSVIIPALSELVGTHLALKLENLQHSGSFKARGAFNKLREVTAAGVVACSAGNHAQGVAYFARRLGHSATIVMPEGTPFTKIQRTEALGARVILHGATLDEAQVHAQAIAAAEHLAFVHPYDDPAIIAGQGTAALEFLDQYPDLDTIVVPIGGGGLIAGVAIAAKAINPQITIIGVEVEAYPSMAQKVFAAPAVDHQVPPSTLAEGIAVKAPGALTAPIVAAHVDEIVLVGETAVENAVDVLVTRGHIVAEGAGAAPLAALFTRPELFAGRRVGCIISGGNIDRRILASVLLRGLARAGRMIRLRVLIEDRPGALARVTAEIAAAGADVVELNHQRLFYDISVKQAELDVVLETRDSGHGERIIDHLAAAGFTAELLSYRAGDQ